jgi:hypothetical protein
MQHEIELELAKYPLSGEEQCRYRNAQNELDALQDQPLGEVIANDGDLEKYCARQTELMSVLDSVRVSVANRFRLRSSQIITIADGNAHVCEYTVNH